jgi:hypothetical protein
MLHPYHGTPAAKKTRPVGKNRRSIVGMELEFVEETQSSCRVGEHRLAAYLEDTLHRAGINPSWFVFERDGSLLSADTLGVEMISRPMSAKTMARLNWAEFFRLLREERRVDLGHPKAGMHFHVDDLKRRVGLSYASALWHRLATMDWDDFHVFFGREPNRYCQVPPVRLVPDGEYVGEDEYGEDIFEETEETYDIRGLERAISSRTRGFMNETRYSPLNLLGDRTSEFRMFPSPASSRELLGALEMVVALGYPEQGMIQMVRDKGVSTVGVLTAAASGSL